MGSFKVSTEYIGKKYIWLSETDSTNSVLKRMLTSKQLSKGNVAEIPVKEFDKAEPTFEEPADGMMVIADYQSLGRGRLGKSWCSPFGKSIALSLLLLPKNLNDGISCITLVAALAVSAAIKKVSGLETQIKWPNDILLSEKKVCGILTELDTSTERNAVIVGVGINVNQEEFPKDIENIATSIFLETAEQTERELIVKNFAEYFEKYYKIFLSTYDMSLLKEEYNGLLVNKGRDVNVLEPDGNIRGKALGIDNEGRLIVKTDNDTHHIYAGEVSVRGIYGYV